VEPGLKDDEGITVEHLHEPILLGDPAGPRAGQHAPKGLGLADPATDSRSASSINRLICVSEAPARNPLTPRASRHTV